MPEDRSRNFLLRYGSILAAGVTSTLWNQYYTLFLRRLDIPQIQGAIIPLLILTAIVITPDVVRVAKGVTLEKNTDIDLPTLIDTVEGSVEYNGQPLFFISEDDRHIFEQTHSQGLSSAKNKINRILFGEYPVIYYNMTAKHFLNWIDYLYLRLLSQIKNRTGAKVIIALHFDEQLYQEGFETGIERDRYDEMYDKSKSIAEAIIGEDVEIIDERWYLDESSEKEFAEYFFSTLISKVNMYVKRVSDGEMSFNKFYRVETNLISIFPALLMADRYGHLLILDYKGSFDVWEQEPFRTQKTDKNIVFVKCNKIEGEGGVRIPAWSESDGPNLTDSVDILQSKLESTDPAVLEAMANIFNVELENEEQIEAALLEKFKSLKQKHGL
jgi:hypothetical protein